jgi:hypothetical protein
MFLPNHGVYLLVARSFPFLYLYLLCFSSHPPHPPTPPPSPFPFPSPFPLFSPSSPLFSSLFFLFNIYTRLSLDLLFPFPFLISSSPFLTPPSPPQTSSLSRLCPNNSTKVNVHEFGFWFLTNTYTFRIMDNNEELKRDVEQYTQQ